MIQIGDPVPDATLTESTEFGDACPVSPQSLSVRSMVPGKRIAVFGLPGAFTPTCSSQHLPGFLAELDALRARGVDEVWCVSVNDGFVMAAWGREQHAIGKIRMLGDGSAEFVRALGLQTEIPGMGVRARRFSMLLDDGVVTRLNVEERGTFGVSSAETLLAQLE